MAEFTLPKNSKIRKGPGVEARRGQAPQDLQDLSLRSGQRRQSALGPLHDRPRQMRADGPRRADQDQERDRPDAYFPALLPRRDLRILRDEHAWAQRTRLHHADRRHQGGGPDHSAAAHGRGQGSGAGPHSPICPICVDPALAENLEPGAVARAAPVTGGPGKARRATTNAFSASAARPAARATGGTPTDTSALPFCCRPIAGLSTAATRRPAIGSTSSRIRSGSTAATRS